MSTNRNKTAQEMDLEKKKEKNTYERSEGQSVANLISEINETVRHVEAKYNDIRSRYFLEVKSI